MAGNRRYEDGWISACGQYLCLIWHHPQTDAEQPYEAEVLHRNITINVIRGTSPQELLDVLQRTYDGAGTPPEPPASAQILGGYPGPQAEQEDHSNGHSAEQKALS